MKSLYSQFCILCSHLIEAAKLLKAEKYVGYKRCTKWALLHDAFLSVCVCVCVLSVNFNIMWCNDHFAWDVFLHLPNPKPRPLKGNEHGGKAEWCMFVEGRGKVQYNRGQEGKCPPLNEPVSHCLLPWEITAWNGSLMMKSDTRTHFVPVFSLSPSLLPSLSS